MRYLIFVLSMPGNNSWNGKWSGEDNYHAIGRKYNNKDETPDRILQKMYHSHNFGDGWCAGIKIKEVNNKQFQTLIKKSVGFAGYEWMVDSIINHNEIKT